MLKRTKSSPIGPAEQDEGGSLEWYVSRVFSQLLLEAKWHSPAGHTASSDRANAVGAENKEAGVHIPTEVSEFLVDALESHVE